MVLYITYYLSTIHQYITFQLSSVVIKKSSCPKIMKNYENVILGQKVVFCGPKKTMMPTESDRDFFTRDIRVVRSSITGSFSLAGEGHRKRGRFPVELPLNAVHSTAKKFFPPAIYI